MSEMVERVAKEIAMEIMESYIPAADFNWPDDASGDTVDRARDRAERIVAAMREPTEAMTAAAVPAQKSVEIAPGLISTFMPLGCNALNNWRRMIDAALK